MSIHGAKKINEQKLNAMRRFALFIIENVNEFEYEQFITDHKPKFALLFSLTLIAENSLHVSNEIKNQFNEFPWCDIVNLQKEILAGNYHSNLELIFEIFKNETPNLMEQIDNMIKTNDDLSS